jgi:hypothetical protein
MSTWLTAQLQAIKDASPNASQKDFLFPHNSFTAFDFFAEVRKAAPHMTTQEYAAYFGHSLAVAQRHYLGYGLDGLGAED